MYRCNLEIILSVGAAVLLTVNFTPASWRDTCAGRASHSLSPGSPNKQGVALTGMATDETANKPVYPAELLRHVKASNETGFDFSGLEQRYSMRDTRERDTSKLIAEAATSSKLTILLRKGGVEDAEEWTHLNDFEGEEWIALFGDVLNCPLSLDEPYTPGDNLNERHEKFRLNFQQAIPDYPMLGRIWDMYNDVTYKPEEIKQLRAECLRAQATTSNEKALRGLAKLLDACEEASRVSSGLLLTCD